MLHIGQKRANSSASSPLLLKGLIFSSTSDSKTQHQCGDLQSPISPIIFCGVLHSLGKKKNFDCFYISLHILFHLPNTFVFKVKIKKKKTPVTLRGTLKQT